MTPDQLRELLDDKLWLDDPQLILKVSDLLPKLLGLWKAARGYVEGWDAITAGIKPWPTVLRKALTALEEAT